MVALTLASPAQTRRLARVLARLLQPPALVTIEGGLGTGKTTLVREIMRARGVRGAVTSPSFTLAQSYRGRQGETLHHLDLYRLRRGADVDLFAWDDYLGTDAVTFVEWPAAGSEALPAADVRLELLHGTLRSRLARLHASAAFEQAAAKAAVAEAVPLGGPAHTQRLLPGGHEVLETAAASWSDVGTVAVGLGPGAFTGLRIGVATARALAQADGRVRLAGVPTPAALALALARAPGAAAHCPLVPLIDGKRREVFAAVYAADEAGGGVRVVEHVTVVPADELTAWLLRLGDVLVGGDGAVLYRGLLPATAHVADGVPAPTAAVLPLYGRAPDAARWTGGGSAARPASSGAAP